MMKQVWVMPNGSEWRKVLTSRRKTIFAKAKTKAELIDKAIQLAKIHKAEYVECGESGQILKKNSYGNDPFPPRDKK